MAEAAAFATAYTTAYVSLIRRGEMKPDDTVLIHGSSGGVGMAAVQLAKMFGNRVIATGTSNEKLEIVKSWGYPFKMDDMNLTNLGRLNDEAGKIFDIAGWK